MLSKRSKTEKTAFGLLIFLSLLDGTLRWNVLPVGTIFCNQGIALSLSLPMPILWLGIGIFLGLALYQSLFYPVSSGRIAWASILVGGSINGLDRLFHGCVQDYLHLPFFPSFNLADIMLFLGVTFLITITLGISPKAKSYVS